MPDPDPEPMEDEPRITVDRVAAPAHQCFATSQAELKLERSGSFQTVKLLSFDAGSGVRLGLANDDGAVASPGCINGRPRAGARAGARARESSAPSWLSGSATSTAETLRE